MEAMEIERRHGGPRMSKIVRYNGLVFLSGQTSSGTSVESVEDQTGHVLRKIDALLAEIGSDKSRLLQAQIHLREMADFDAMNRVWEAWVTPGATPARTTVQARLASPELRVEITVIAAA
jgi:enamine deaminase RidA (YjgF/YER057c/UK114 family)